MLDSLKLLFNPSFETRVSLELREAKANLLHAQSQLESAQCYVDMLKLRVARLRATEIDNGISDTPVQLSLSPSEGILTQEQ